MQAPFLLDHGSFYMKSGLSEPNLSISCVGHSYFPRVIHGEQFISQNAYKHKGILSIEYPSDTENYSQLMLLWNYIYEKHVVQSDQFPLFYTLPPIYSTKNVDQLMQVFMEQYNHPAISMVTQPILSLYGLGKTSGIVLDIGHAKTSCMALYQGHKLTNTLIQTDLGGRKVTEYLQLLLRKQGHSFTSSSEFLIVNDMKKSCQIVKDVLKSTREYISSGAQTPYTLPDGQIIDLGMSHFMAPEVLFDPKLMQMTCPSVTDHLLHSLLSADVDIRSELAENIVICGGSSLFLNTGDRLLHDLKQKYHTHTAVTSLGTQIAQMPRVQSLQQSPNLTLKLNLPPERLYSSWVGAQIISQLDTFKHFWVSKEEYTEDPYLIHKRIF
eukprot:NODE_71_length_23666_cov_0.239403.p7 type:complete len:382 gc:universal NODE_71_length_23666_cov_0.239403:16266-15121(-)